ncbi:MAG: hypothetical protein ACTSUE_13150 [Promethearchaeota archaeon]
MRSKKGKIDGIKYAATMGLFVAMTCFGIVLVNNEQVYPKFSGEFPLPSTPMNVGDTESALLNSSIGEINYTMTLSNAANRYEFQLAVPSGCDFDLELYDIGNNMVASSAGSEPSNESVTYKPSMPGIYNASIVHVSGEGTFNFTVTEIPNTGAPELYNYSVSSNNTIIFTEYRFETWYNDSDGFEPEYVNLILDGVGYSMARDGASGINYTLGVMYYVTFPKLEVGEHPFTFNASDGFPVVLVGTLHVNVVKPDSLLVDAGTMQYEPFDPGFNGGVGWVNSTNRDSWELQSSVYKSGPSSIGIQALGGLLVQTTGMLETPLYELAAGEEIELIFGHVAYNIVVLVDVSVNVNLSGTWDVLDTLTFGSGEWVRMEYNLTAYAGSYVKFRFDFNAYNPGAWYLDDFTVRTRGSVSPGIPISNVILSPTSGNQFTRFKFDLTYTNALNNYPVALHLTIMDGLTLVKDVDFREEDGQDWDVTDGKDYYCDFQFIQDVEDPSLIITCDYGYIIPYVWDYAGLLVANDNLLGETSLPMMLDFESGSPVYYILNDPCFGVAKIDVSGGNHYFTTLADVDVFSSLPVGAYDLGLITSVVNLTSDIQCFLSFDSNLDLGIGDEATLSVSTDGGYTWETIIQYNDSVVDSKLVNITGYRGEMACFKFQFSTTSFNLLTASWEIDNISIHERDFTAPTIESTNAGEGKWLFGDFSGKSNLKFTVSDVGFGVESIVIEIDGEEHARLDHINTSTVSLEINCKAFSMGFHNFTVRVIDESGNEFVENVQMRTDGTRILVMFGIIAGVVAGISLVTLKMKKSKVSARQIPSMIKKRITEPEKEPASYLVGKIKEITSVFRKINIEQLANKISVDNLDTRTLKANLRYMLGHGLISGIIQGDLFIRKIRGKGIPETREGMMKALGRKQETIIEEINASGSIPIDDLLEKVGFKGIDRGIMMDFIFMLVKEGKVNCYFDDELIVNEKDVNGFPSPLPISSTRQTSSTKPTVPVNADSSKSPTTEERIIGLLSSKQQTTFRELKNTLILKESIDDIEDLIFDLIKKGKIKGSLELDGFRKH